MPDSKSYVAKKSTRLTILPEEIQTLVDMALRKTRLIIQAFVEVLLLEVR